MVISREEALRRLRETLREVGPDVKLDAPWVMFVPAPYPGFRYGLVLGQANAMLFMPLREIDGADWPDRLRARLTEAVHYLEGFPLSKIGR